MTEAIAISTAEPTDIKYIDHLQRVNADALSFYPTMAFEREVEKRRIILARVNGEPAGYLYHGALGGRVAIHQAAIEYDLRGQLYGAALVKWLADLAIASSSLSLRLRCGSDIEANGFWRAMGFECVAVSKGGIRRMRDINQWERELVPSFFGLDAVEPSTAAQDASVWRKARKQGISANRFWRGRTLVDNREATEDSVS